MEKKKALICRWQELETLTSSHPKISDEPIWKEQNVWLIHFSTYRLSVVQKTL